MTVEIQVALCVDEYEHATFTHNPVFLKQVNVLEEGLLLRPGKIIAFSRSFNQQQEHINKKVSGFVI